jgi:hypothetical protein
VGPAAGFTDCANRRAERGVSLTEFALVVPIFVALLFAMLEFGFAFNVVLAINRASQDGALIAGQAGSDSDADCQILQRVERELQSPLDKSGVLNVRVVRTNSTGSSVLASNAYTRSGNKDCGDYTVPYSASSTGYPESQRCDILAGCPSLTPARTTVDKIGVQITYRYTPVTPMGDLLRLLGGDGTTGTTWTFTKQNLSRMEPVQ